MSGYKKAIAKSILCFLLIAPVVTAAGPIELKFNYSMPKKEPPVPPANGWHWFATELEKQSGGRLKISMYPNEELFKIDHAVNGIKLHLADITNISMKIEADRFPLMSVTLLPTIVWPATAKGTVASSRAMMKLYKEFPEIQQEFKDFKVICFNQLPDYHLISKRPVRLPPDLKGMAIGAGGIEAELIRRQGGKAEAMSPPQAQTAFETGVFDGMLLSYSSMNLYQIWKYARYTTEISFGRVPLPVIMNKDVWNALPPDVQELINQLGDKQLEIGATTLYENVQKGKEELVTHGVVIATFMGPEAKTWIEAFAPAEKIWLDKMKEKGLADAAAKVLKRYKQLAAEAAEK
jgi:TRAP-type C4-dicarboxylate transport system substrate-binding protein